MSAETLRDENRRVGMPAGLAHEALLYRGPDELVAAIVPFVRDALAAGEPVLVALPAPNLNLLAEALDEAALDEAALDEAALDGAALDRAASGETAPGDTARGEAARGEAARGEAAAGEVTAGGPALGEVALSEPALSEPALSRATRGEVAPGAPADRLRLVDMTEAGRNPGRIIPWVLHAFIQRHAGKRVRIVGESIWAGRTAEEYPACAQHEALVNVTLAGYPATILCPFDASRLDPQVLTDAGRTHPVVTGDGRRWCSPEYRPESVIGAYDQPLPDVPACAAAVEFDGTGLAELRDLIADRARRAGMTERRVVDLQLAVNELVSNAVLHGAGGGTLWMWTVAGGLACEVRDHGRALVPLAGRVPPGPGSVRGRGLVLVNYVSDLVRIHTRPDGTAVRLYMRF
jgi:anti-sigma regulatory factor (Ser/Thr protein kinase)